MGIPTDVPLTGCRYHVFGMPGEERPKRIRRSQEIAAVKRASGVKKENTSVSFLAIARGTLGCEWTRYTA